MRRPLVYSMLRGSSMTHSRPWRAKKTRKGGKPRGGAAGPLHVRGEERVQDVVARGQRAHVPLAQELAHDRQAVEGFGEHVVVRAARRRLGVVLGEAQAAGVGDEEGVEPRDGARLAEAGVDAYQRALPVSEPELVDDRVVGERRLVRGREGLE